MIEFTGILDIEGIMDAEATLDADVLYSTLGKELLYQISEIRKTTD